VPEGDTVWLAGYRLRKALTGERITRSDFRVPRYATADLSGRRILDISSRGKHLLWRLEEGLTLHSHFKMDGSWHLYRRGQRWRSPSFQARVVLDTQRWQAVGFRLAVLDLIPTDRESDVVGHLGPDLLGEDWDPAEAVRNLGARANVPIGEALLDQSIVAGLGNVYRSELCFLWGVDPWTPVAEVSDLPGLVDLARRVLQANRHSGRQVTTGVDRPGRTRYVYGRGGKACRRCGTPVRRTDQASYGLKRVIYWCPSCQPSQERKKLQASQNLKEKECY
jgi:endonuclease VIII